MNEPLTQSRIIEAAEEVLRRFGPQKTNVVDVARALGVSHGAVYRHFPSKTALREAVAARWLHAITEPLEAIVAAPEAADQRLRRWLTALHGLKRRKILDDPEIFASYTALVGESRDVVAAHVTELRTQMARIVADGIGECRFRDTDPDGAARAILDGTARFHHPLHAHEWKSGDSEAGLARVIDLLLNGLERPDQR